MISERKQYKKYSLKKYKEFIIGADVGGTNTNLGIAGVKNDTAELLFSNHYRTQELRSLSEALNHFLEETKSKGIVVWRACIAGAGLVDRKKGLCRLTNVEWDINVEELKEKTHLKDILLLNDFEALGYGINMLSRKDLITVLKGKPEQKDVKAVIGAGTGLGKSFLVYDENKNIHVPYPSEGGHTNFPVKDIFELELVQSIKKERLSYYTPDFEDFLSGQGLVRIYEFLLKKKNYRKTRYTEEIAVSQKKEHLISAYKSKDPACRDTYEFFTKIYARCAKNYALNTKSLGGLYIAGGIAAKNKEIFKTLIFKKEFFDNEKMQELLKRIPVYAVLDYNIGMKGACLAYVKTKNNL